MPVPQLGALSILNDPHPHTASLGAAWQLHGSRAGFFFYNLHGHRLGDGYVGGLWSPGKLQSQRSFWVPSNREGVPGGSWPRGLWAGSEEGLGDFVRQQSPQNPCLGALHPWSWPLSATNLLWDFVQRASPLWACFPSCHTGSLVPSPWSDAGTVGVTKE